MVRICYAALIAVTVILVCQQLPRCTGQFFVGPYKTIKDSYLPEHHYPNNINDLDGAAETASSSGRSSLQKRQLFLSTFNPSRGTIYMAFMFLMPLAVRPKLGRSFTDSMEIMGSGLKRDDKTIYNEMGYVDGNLLIRKVWNQWRVNMLTKWKDKFAFKKFKKKNSEL